MKGYLYIIRRYLGDTINNHKSQDGWRTHLSMVANFISSKDSNGIRTIYTESDNIEIILGSETDKIIQKRFESYMRSYQEGLEVKMEGSDFVFDSADLLHYKMNKISLNRAESYLDSLE